MSDTYTPSITDFLADYYAAERPDWMDEAAEKAEHSSDVKDAWDVFIRANVDAENGDGGASDVEAAEGALHAAYAAESLLTKGSDEIIEMIMGDQGIPEFMADRDDADADDAAREAMKDHDDMTEAEVGHFAEAIREAIVAAEIRISAYYMNGEVKVDAGDGEEVLGEHTGAFYNHDAALDALWDLKLGPVPVEFVEFELVDHWGCSI